MRVEVHRLRKRLREFYEGAGKDHALQWSIPSGTYFPVITRKAAEVRPTIASQPQASADAISDSPTLNLEPPPHPVSGQAASVAVSGLKQHRNWILAGLAAGLIATAVIATVIFSRLHSARPSASAAGSATRALVVPPQGGLAATQVPLRLLAGYSGAPQTDSAGRVWYTDQYVHGGGPWTRPDTAIARTSDPLIFEHWRSGDSTYAIPLQPGVYELHLYFVSADAPSVAAHTFTIKINGEIVLSAFDINSDAMSENIADERVFRDVSPAADGMLHVSFTTEGGAPQINALELLPGISHKQLPIRLVMRQTSFTDHNGQLWQPDNYYTNGRLSEQGREIAGSPDPDLFSTERYGHFFYAIPVDPHDRYTLVLHFVEFYFGTAGDGSTGRRLFKVMCNGNTLLDNFDIYKEAGSLHDLTKTFHHLKPSPQGKLNITFEPIENNATVSGIEVLDESQ